MSSENFMKIRVMFILQFHFKEHEQINENPNRAILYAPVGCYSFFVNGSQGCNYMQLLDLFYSFIGRYEASITKTGFVLS